MSDLDTSGDPVALVPGDPAALHETAWTLGVTADVLQEAAAGLARLGTPDGWSGDAADRFRSAFAVQPARWEDAATAHRTAADAVEQHAVALEYAQRQAAEAARLWAVRPGSPDAIRLLADARSRVEVSGDRAATVVEAARDRAPEASVDVASVVPQLGNAGASFGQAMLRHPLDVLGMAAGGGLAAVGAAGFVGGAVLDGSGVGAVAGLPLGAASAAGVAAGVGLAGAGAIDLALNAAGPDRVQPFRVDADAQPDTEPVAEPPPFEPPAEITGMTEHGRQQAEGRDNGVGVSDEAMADAVANPVEPPEYRANGTFRYRGQDAVVALNESGGVVTTWPKTSKGYRNR